jgi:hypothetical protein
VRGDEWNRAPTILLDRSLIVVGKGGYLDCFDATRWKWWAQPFEGLGTGCLAIGVPGNIVEADNAR